VSVTLKLESTSDLPKPTKPNRFLGSHQWYSQNWPLLAALLVLWLTVAGLFVLSVRQETVGFHPPYALDDVYIHMAIAKNLVQHGIWGVNPYEFSSVSSSLLWPLLLAASYLFTKVNEYAPFGLNLIFASLILVCIHYNLRKYRVARLYLFGLLLAVILLAPLPTLIFVGMEHNLHILVLLLFINLSLKVLSQSKSDWKTLTLWLGLAVLATTVRYESLFIVAVISGLLLLRRHWWEAGAVAIAASAPVGIYGLFSMANGSLWLPNSIVIKSHPFMLNFGSLFNLFGYSDFKGKEHIPFLVAPHLLTLAIATLLVYRTRYSERTGFWNDAQLWLVIFGVTAFLHLQLAGIGWFYRYEDYVIVLGLVGLAHAWFEDWETHAPTFGLSRKGWPKHAATIILAFVLLLPLSDRAVRALDLTPQANTNIYEQQYQVGLFLRQYYTGEAVAANDIGAINYLADLKSVDLSGLGTVEITRLARENPATQQAHIVTILHTRGVKIAVVLDGYSPPVGWIAVGRWQTPNPVVLAADTVWFYALADSEVEHLRTSLQQFGPNLPKTVQQTIIK